MSYFTAVIAGDGRGWRARDVDIEDAGGMDDLADLLRAASYRDGPVLAVIEHEDEWFAIVRVDPDGDPRVFVSDLAAAARSPYAELFAPALEEDERAALPTATRQDPDEDGPEEDQADRQEEEHDPDDDHEPDVAELVQDADPGGPVASDVDPWAGEPDLLADLGCGGGVLRRLVTEDGDDPAAALAEVGELCGFGELLDALR
ncbi:tRNA adenosine deaminase-associated protein [Kineosporiaceae bacterium SCSIO 59966]|nr:tRNA adenosine deaminase-associated protein [Kineosporiaceae bacterium SCSIO 59966]